MPNFTHLVEIINGQKKGWWPTVVRGLLSSLERVYQVIIWLRNRRFDRGRNVTELNSKVISIGNLTTGGTGKTPFVIWLAKQIESQSTKVAIISRGYGSRNGEKNDEALEIQQLTDNIPHLQDPDRVRIAQQAINEHDVDAIIVDDGFQHRRLARDLDIVLVDATCPFGYDRLLPRGLLREPVTSLRRADIVVLTRSDLASAMQREKIHDRVRASNPNAIWVETRTVTTGLQSSDGNKLCTTELEDKRIMVLCGIGNPSGFLGTLEKSRLNITAQQIFADHHAFREPDLDLVQSLARDFDCDAIVCTLKDLVKIRRTRLGPVPLYALAIEIEITVGLNLLQNRIKDCLNSGTSGIGISAAEPGGGIAA